MKPSKPQEVPRPTTHRATRRRRAWTWAAGVLLACLWALPAQAKLFDLYGSLKAGGITGGGFKELRGQGPGGQVVQGADYFDIERGPASGLELGVELLFIDVSLQAFQMFELGKNPSVRDDGAFAGTLFQFLVGLDVDIPLDSGARPSWYLRLGANGGVALGLHRRVNPPLDNGEVASKGFVGQGIAALEYHLNDVFYLGAEFVPGYHYFVPGGDNPVNESSQGLHYMGFLTFQVHVDPMTWGKKK